MEDELSAFLKPSHASPKHIRKRKSLSCVSPILSPDDGIGMSSDSMNDSIASAVKRRQRSCRSKQFDSKFFYDSVVQQIENKYKKRTKDDDIIDLNEMQIIQKKGSIERRDRTDIGYFADNTLEDLRQKSFRDNRLI
ncbi:unnamed protein product, partial [Oppiella nova]